MDHGVGALSLRPLAAHLGTSDRMLLYYFGSRDGIVTAICKRLTRDLESLFAASVPPRPLPPALLLGYAWNTVSAPQLRQAFALYLEVDALAARGVAPFTTAASDATAAGLNWLSTHLDSPPEVRPAVAAALLAIVDGLLLQSAVHPASPTDDAHQWLSQLFNSQFPSANQ